MLIIIAYPGGIIKWIYGNLRESPVALTRRHIHTLHMSWRTFPTREGWRLTSQRPPVFILTLQLGTANRLGVEMGQKVAPA